MVGFGVRVMGLRRLTLGLRRGVLGFGSQWVELGYWELGFGGWTDLGGVVLGSRGGEFGIECGGFGDVKFGLGEG